MQLSVQFDCTKFTNYMATFGSALDARVEPLRSSMSKAMGAMLRDQQIRFFEASQGNGMWPPLKPATIAARLRKKGGKGTRRHVLAAAIQGSIPILYDTGELESALFGDGSGHFESAQRDAVIAGVRGGTHSDCNISMGELAMAHQLGVPENNLPPRPVYGEVQPRTLGYVADYVSLGIQGALNQISNI